MRIGEVPVADVRWTLTDQRGRLVGLLGSLSDEQWAAPTAAPQWTVKHVALHLVDADLRWLAHGRDDDRTGIIPVPPDHQGFVRALAERNQRWVDGTVILSPRLIIDLLSWSGEQLDAFLRTLDLTRPSSVYWAGDVPVWFDLAREFTERWVHYQQILQAAGLDGQHDEYLPLVMRTFIWGFPHQYKAKAATGTTVALTIAGVGAWTLTRTATDWTLDEGQADEPAAGLRMTAESAWRLLTGASYDTSQVQLTGELALARPLLDVRGIIV